MKLLRALGWMLAGLGLVVLACLSVGNLGAGMPSVLLWGTLWVAGVASIDHGARQW